MSSAPFLLLRIPSLKLRVRGRKEAFEANLKTETELWNLMVKEMWAGRDMADQHKVAPNESFLCEITWRAATLFCFFCSQDPQYMQQALTNALLMDAVVGSLQSSKATYAASKLAHFDRIKMEGKPKNEMPSSSFHSVKQDCFHIGNNKPGLITHCRNQAIVIVKLYRFSCQVYLTQV